ncbi:DivIVA domain-containing protein [candidate division WOR-3 bacterium]|nr:DivIVA domain-containing protein [candidate division WOR-3 bacterium]
MKLTPLDIKKQEFKKVFRGYDPNEVNNFLSMVAEEMEALARENAELMERLSTQEIKLDEYKNLEKSLQDTLIMAQKTTEEVRKNATRESDLLVKKSKVEAQKILQEAKSEKERIETEISRLRRQREMFIVQYRSVLQAQLDQLENILKQVKSEEEAKNQKEEAISIFEKQEDTISDKRQEVNPKPEKDATENLNLFKPEEKVFNKEEEEDDLEL